MAEISPEHAARIESLRAQHAENPARFFVPLASAYREAGEGARAEELLRENLKRHPGYVSAHVLLGRCLADRGAVAEARNEFRYVLSVDSQNLIALRSLGEMASAGGDRDEARRWYGELLAVDPMNADARDALAGLDAADAAPAAPAPPEASAAPAEGGTGYGMVDIAEAPEGEGYVGAPAPDAAWGEVELHASADAPPAGDSATPADFNAFEFGAVDLDANAAAGDADEAAPQAPAAAPSDSWGSIDDDAQAADVAPLPGLEGTFYGADEHAGDDGEEVVTETMAELYARQGFVDRAAGMYRALIARRGEEPALVRRLEELRRQLDAGADAEAAAAEQPEDEEPAETPEWLETVDFSISASSSSAGGSYAAADDQGGDDRTAPLDFDVSGAASPPEVAEGELRGLIPAHDVLPPADFGDEDHGGGDETEDAYAGTGARETASVAATGDPFADSFAYGFGGGEAPAAEADAGAFAATLGEPEPAEVAAFAVASSDEAAPEPEAPSTVVAYLRSILAWRPGRAPAPPSAVDAGTASPELEASDYVPPAALDAVPNEPPPAAPWDEMLDAPAAQPPLGEPWMVGAESTEADAEPWAAEPAADADPEEPWASADTSGEALAPSAEAGDEAGEAADDLPWMSTEVEHPAAEGGEAAEPAGSAAPSGELMPWEVPFDLAEDAAEAPTTERVPPRDEPVAQEGAFSFEDFFAPPAPPPAPAAQPEPEAPPPSAAEAEAAEEEEDFPLPQEAPEAPPAAEEPRDAAPPPAAPAGEEDEDLESFQAWLQSLKR